MIFRYEAMDASGQEVVDRIEANSPEDAQTKIRQLGLFVTKVASISPVKITPKNAVATVDADKSQFARIVITILAIILTASFVTMLLITVMANPVKTPQTESKPVAIEKIELNGHHYLHDPNCSCKKS